MADLSGQQPIRIQSTIQNQGNGQTTSTTQITDAQAPVPAPIPIPPRQKYEQLKEKQKQSDEQNGPGKLVASKEIWSEAWKEKQQEQHANNVRKEDASDPTPLLIDKSSALPFGYAETLHSEGVKATIDNTTANVGDGLDTLTRESYKEIKKLTRHSDMLQEGIREPLPSADQIVGEEEGTVVSNLQSWKPTVTNAVKPVSDATGSHADTASSVTKTPLGADQFLPASSTAAVDNITPQFTNETDTSFKSVQMDTIQHLPSKMMGSVRNLSTASDPKLAVPFEIASDVYNGLFETMNSLANAVDGVMAVIKMFEISPVGGLINGLFPTGQLLGIINPINSIASKVDELDQLLGGFLAVTGITSIIQNIAADLSAILSDPSKIADLFKAGANIASIVGGSGFAGKSLGCAGSQIGMSNSPGYQESAIENVAEAIGGVLGVLELVGSGLGNLGAILGGGINSELGASTADIRRPEQIIPGLLPPEITNAMKKLDQMCCVGMVGNAGFSVGNSMDSLRNNSFSKSMSELASHAAIVGPLFNKKVNKTGAYVQDSSLAFFDESIYVKGAQGNKGFTMLGPGSTASQKSFGSI